MSRFILARSALALALLSAVDVHAASNADLAQIRDEIRQLRESYEARIRALEQRLQDATARDAPLPAAAPSPAAAPAPAASAAPPASAGTSGISAFNPAISAVLQGRYANLSQDPARYAALRRPTISARASAASASPSRNSRCRRTSMTGSPAT